MAHFNEQLNLGFEAQPLLERVMIRAACSFGDPIGDRTHPLGPPLGRDSFKSAQLPIVRRVAPTTTREYFPSPRNDGRFVPSPRRKKKLRRTMTACALKTSCGMRLRASVVRLAPSVIFRLAYQSKLRKNGLSEGGGDSVGWPLARGVRWEKLGRKKTLGSMNKLGSRNFFLWTSNVFFLLPGCSSARTDRPFSKML